MAVSESQQLWGRGWNSGSRADQADQRGYPPCSRRGFRKERQAACPRSRRSGCLRESKGARSIWWVSSVQTTGGCRSGHESCGRRRSAPFLLRERALCASSSRRKRQRDKRCTSTDPAAWLRGSDTFRRRCNGFARRHQSPGPLRPRLHPERRRARAKKDRPCDRIAPQ